MYPAVCCVFFGHKEMFGEVLRWLFSPESSWFYVFHVTGLIPVCYRSHIAYCDNSCVEVELFVVKSVT